MRFEQETLTSPWTEAAQRLLRLKDMLHKSLGWDLATREPVGPQPGSGVQGTGHLLGTAAKCVVWRVVNDMFIQSQIITTIN